MSATTDVIGNVIRQHIEGAASLHATRSALVRAPHVTLTNLGHFDNLLVAHLEGVALAGPEGWALSLTALEQPSAGSVFTLAVRAIEEKRFEQLEDLFALSEAAAVTRAGLMSAFGWLGRDRLQGLVSGLLSSDGAFKRLVGITACALHRVDPGASLIRMLHDTSPVVRSRALRASGEVGSAAAAATCTAALRDEDSECQFWGAWSAVLLGQRSMALQALLHRAATDDACRSRAFRIALQGASTATAHAFLKDLASDASQLGWLIQGSGIAGDAMYIPWLISHMREDKTARLAGEAFSLIAGADLPVFGLDRPRPENFESGPNDNPDDPNVDMDPDEGLPWPDPDKIEKWWGANSSRFHKGTRYFMGAPVTREHCIEVLKHGYQRQRVLAAHYLCLLDPGTPLFNTSAPAWRQQRLLARM